MRNKENNLIYYIISVLIALVGVLAGHFLLEWINFPYYPWWK